MSQQAPAGCPVSDDKWREWMVSQKRKSPSDVWKWLCAVLAGLLIGILTGKYEPNRDIVTRDDLNPIIQTSNNTNEQVSQIAQQLAELKGELKARKEVGP